MKQVEIKRFAPLEYAANEAINTLCTNLTFSRENLKKVMITSSHASEGKTFLALNIMRCMAKLGKKVVLVDADMRASVMNAKYRMEYTGGKAAVGLAHMLAGMAKTEDVVYQSNINGACIVPIGRTVMDALALLTSSRFDELLCDLEKEFDLVLVDAPPVGIVIDAAAIAKSCDGALVAVCYNQVHRQELIRVRDQLQKTGCPILGTVLNQVEYDEFMGKNYYYKAYYGKYGKYGHDK